MTKSSKTLLTIAVVLLALAAVVLYLASAVFFQLFIAFALAYILNPAVRLLERRGVNRIVSIIAVFLGACVIVTGFGAFLGMSISGELSSMQINLPAYAQRLYEIVPPAVKSYLGIETPEKLALRMNELLASARGIAPDVIKPVLNILRAAFSSTIAFILAVLGYFVIPVYLFYLLADMQRLKELVDSLVPERFRPAYRERLAEVDAVLSGFVRGQLSVCAILAVLYSIGLYIIGIDLAIAIGTLAGITFIIPYVGTIIGICLSVVMAFLKFHDLLHPLLCLGWFAIVQGAEGMLITPRVVGNRVGLHPLVTIVALLIGGQMFGIMGMLLAVPLTAVLQVFLRSLAGYYRDSDFFRGAP